ncbi:DEAD/DEAH box helicase family protein [Candidatus Pelagibacter ubique]|nr:DEAD/DEAH box helicase family protein [Candidatus Pelagibacter ubique]
MKFNEDSRVKIPTILHCMRLGFEYVSLKKQSPNINESTNIFSDVFFSSIQKINPGLSTSEVKQALDEISLALENEDLGRAFYKKLINKSGVRLIDYENFDQNTFQVVTELTYKNGEDEFRPDITLLINGMPLVFIEVKKPNNRDGVIAEHKRIQSRFSNKKFRNFANITQLMIFSNNMEYDESSPHPVEGAFYASSSYNKTKFNYFREELEFNLDTMLLPISENDELSVLKDNNLISIKNSPEFEKNKNPDTPTNRICTSLLSRERLGFILEFAFAYVEKEEGLQKHIMRYPQFFASKAITKKLDSGVKNGIIWHTQGSGKTALAFYNVRYLSNYFQKKDQIAKFYFIVDRLDLLKQASGEFRNRGLVVHNISSREAFAEDIKNNAALHNSSGSPEITVVNIQKFEDDPSVVQSSDYNLDVQRIFFLDEVHRSYNPKGSFLANLEQADRTSIKIGLTGTPLLGKEYNSKSLFGDYIHKYYYNASIKDGYTLRLIREDIETNYKLTLKKALEEIDILKGDADRTFLYSHPKFVEPMLDYIVKDLEKARITTGDFDIGGMVVCDSAAQAREMNNIFQKKYASPNKNTPDEKKDIKTAQLILYDEGDKETREDWVLDFKRGKLDLLFVYNMLLTGFDAERLKKLYLGRVIKAHNLLQALTRVNRPFNEFEYGYVIDFADIQKEFEKTNRDYLKELESELGDETESYSNLFKSEDEIQQEIEDITEELSHFDIVNAEVFSQQISSINDRKEMLKITNALNNAKNLYNVIRLSGKYDMLDRLDFKKLTTLSREADNRLAMINLKEALVNKVDTQNLINIALEDVIFAFIKVGEGEMLLADELKNTIQKTREGLGGNFDPQDPKFISLKEELERLFKKKNLTEVSKEEMESNIKALNKIYDKAKELDRKNQLLKAKYNNDEKYARLHKRLMEKDPLTDGESKLFDLLNGLKKEVDLKIEQNTQILENENYVNQMVTRLIIDEFNTKNNISLTADVAKNINTILVKEYMREYRGESA